MNLIQKLTNELDMEINRVWQEYIDLQKEWNTYRGKPIEELVPENVEKTFQDIQHKFDELYPAFNLIAIRHQYVNNAVGEYNEFITQMLKNKNAQPDQPESKIIMPGGDGRINS